MAHLHSISHAGMALFDRPIRATIGGITLDLASAPITPGTHRLELDVTIGGIEIFLPSYVKFTVEGGATIGGHDVHDGAGLLNRLGAWLHLPIGVPVRAVASPDPTQETRIHFVIDGGIGGIDIYRLPT